MGGGHAALVDVLDLTPEVSAGVVLRDHGQRRDSAERRPVQVELDLAGGGADDRGRVVRDPGLGNRWSSCEKRQGDQAYRKCFVHRCTSLWRPPRKPCTG